MGKDFYFFHKLFHFSKEFCFFPILHDFFKKISFFCKVFLCLVIKVCLMTSLGSFYRRFIRKTRCALSFSYTFFIRYIRLRLIPLTGIDDFKGFIPRPRPPKIKEREKHLYKLVEHKARRRRAGKRREANAESRTKRLKGERKRGAAEFERAQALKRLLHPLFMRSLK